MAQGSKLAAGAAIAGNAVVERIVRLHTRILDTELFRLAADVEFAGEALAEKLAPSLRESYPEIKTTNSSGPLLPASPIRSWRSSVTRLTRSGPRSKKLHPGRASSTPRSSSYEPRLTPPPSRSHLFRPASEAIYILEQRVMLRCLAQPMVAAGTRGTFILLPRDYESVLRDGARVHGFVQLQAKARQIRDVHPAVHDRVR